MALTSAFTTQKNSNTMRALSRAMASAAERAAVARVDADRLEARRGGALQGGNEEEENEEEVHGSGKMGYWLIVTVAVLGDVTL